MEKRIVIPRIVVRPILPPPLEIGARIRPQWLHWQVGRYVEKLSFGPGGEGRGRVWVPQMEGEQHNLILNGFYDSIIPSRGFIFASYYAAVGTGSTAPDPSQTQLANEIGTSSISERTNTVPTGESNGLEAQASPGEYIIRRVYEFPETSVGGLNLTEWGFSPYYFRNGQLMTRELFRDDSGNPVVLTLATDQRLRLIYRYKVTVSPTSPQNVSINIGGDGPGIRTAKFLLTAKYEGAANHGGIVFPSDGQRGGDLLVIDALVQGTQIGSLGYVGISGNTAPLTYIHSVGFISATPPPKALSYNEPVGRSRTAYIQSEATEHNITIKSVVLNGDLFDIPSSSISYATPTGNLVFDDGQEFTKDNLHRLFIGYWQVTWGP
jgi:hypothetical protein